MEKLLGDLKRNLKLAFKTVTFHFRQYLCFYIALLIIETLFGFIVMSASNNIKNVETETERLYNYHFTLTGLNEAQMDYFTDPDGTYAGERLGMNHALGNIEVVERYVRGTKVYDLKCTLECDKSENIKDLGQLYERFCRVYASGLKRVNVEFSPLYNLSERTGAIKGNCVVWLLLLAAVSCVVLILLYNIRINHFKFTYGIYMSFGADCKRLFATCFWEVLVISFLTVVPSAIISTVSDFLFYKLAGYSYHFAPQLALLALVYIVPVVIIAVYIPVKTMAIKPPLKLLLAEDNSNLVVSPRLSFQMFGTKFPSSYERFGLWRFRKYNIQLIFSAVLFSALFVLTSYYGSVYKYTVSAEKAEYTISFPQHVVKYEEEELVLKNVHDEYYTLKIKEDDGTLNDKESERLAAFEADRQNFIEQKEPVKFIFGDYDAQHQNYKIIQEITYEKVQKTRLEGDTYTPEKRDELMKISGVTSVYKQCVTDAFVVDSHVLFGDADTRVNSGFLIHPTLEDSSATSDVKYFAADDEVVKFIKENYTYVGEPDDLLKKDKQIIISDSLNNSKVLKIKPSDTVRIAKAVEIPTYSGKAEDLIGDRYLAFLLENGKFEYDTYTVCAVIDDIPSDQGMPMFVNGTGYEKITGSAPVYKSVSVYIDGDLDEAAVNDITSDIRSWAERYSDTVVKWNNALTDSRSERAMRKLPLIDTIAVMLLVISPLFWFFSQIMFYKKREKEFELLRGMGAIESEIRKIFIYDGLVMALLGVVATVLLSAAGTFAIYTLTIKLLPLISEGMKVRFVFRIPWVAGIVAVLATAVCGFTSAFLPYISEKKNSEKRLSEEFGE